MVADANHGIPLTQVVTTSRRNDSPLLSEVVDRAKALHDWFGPDAVMADRGYDSAANHRYLYDQGIKPIIHIRRSPYGKKANGENLQKGIYTTECVPTCLGMVPMEYVETNTEGHHLYRCQKGGCYLLNSRKGGFLYCDTEYWQDPTEDIRLFGVVRRDIPEWKALYSKRYAIERVFKSEKESRRLERHCVRGLRNIILHTLCRRWGLRLRPW